MAGWVVGQEVTCPRCGQVGRAGIDVFKAKGKEYRYWTVRHYAEGRVRRCIVGPVAEGSGTEAVAPPQVGTAAQVPSPRVGPQPAAQIPEVQGRDREAGFAVQPAVQVPEVVEVAEIPVPPTFADTTPIPPEVDRVAWYVVKVTASWGSFRENPSQENFARFVRTVNQAAQRTGIPCADVVAAAEYFMKARSERAKMIVNEAVKRFIARVVVANTAYFASAAVSVPAAGTSISVPEEVVAAVKEVSTKVSEIAEEVAAMRQEVEYIKEQVRQRKGPGARAVARGEKKVEIKEGSVYWMIREIMRSGGEWTKEQIVEEIFRRFGRRVSGNSVSGRMSEMAAAGYVMGRREGRTWVWRWVGP